MQAAAALGRRGGIGSGASRQLSPLVIGRELGERPGGAGVRRSPTPVSPRQAREPPIAPCSLSRLFLVTGASLCDGVCAPTRVYEGAWLGVTGVGGKTRKPQLPDSLSRPRLNCERETSVPGLDPACRASRDGGGRIGSIPLSPGWGWGWGWQGGGKAEEGSGSGNLASKSSLEKFPDTRLGAFMSKTPEESSSCACGRARPGSPVPRRV